ncbi:cytochrome P450 [Sphingomonas histidinilytica]|uniref:cytochrome P450 n=1 Tax=Rhizorhabdus histidinilytica TaxID=439228 RepID=UPI001ADA89E1|nr:cytochrome P450 [Rhizorhabdus histidinilytica]MBO9376914.1 cytochrome P450 [Rhizorhabdus histidinilytica]
MRSAEQLDTPEAVLAVIFAPNRPDDIYPWYHRLRALAPLHHVAGFHGQPAWIASSWSAVHRIARDPRMRSDPKTLDIYSVGEAGRGFDAMMRRLMLFLPRTDHDRVRATVSASFTPRAVETHRRLARQVVDRLIDDLAEGHFDLVRDFAYPLPVFIICRMMGIPHEDVPLFIGWAHDFAARGDIGPRLGAEAIRAGEAATAGFQDYFARLIARRRRDPGDDLMSAMIAGRAGGVALTDDEIVAAAVLLLQAGHSTTADLIGMGTRHLLLHPDQWRLLIERPDIVAGAVMELLRYDSSVQMSHRVAVEDFEVEGRTIRKGDLCLLLNGAANRDPAAVPDPDRLDLLRTGINTAPFGGGPYMCLGQYLARVELQEAFLGLTRRMPDLALCGEDAVYAGGVTLRGLAALPVRSDRPHRHAA